MSALSVAQGLEEVDVEKQLKHQEAEGEDTSSIVLSDKGDESSAEESEEADDASVSPTFDQTPEPPQSEEADDTPSKEAEPPELQQSEEAEETLEQKSQFGLAKIITPTAEEAETTVSQVEKVISEELASSSDEETDEEDNETMKKLEQDINKDILYAHHPEITQINYRELLTLSQVTRNTKGIIVDPLHTTLGFLTRYEKAKILGLRAKQINHGSKPFVNVPTKIMDGHIIAKMELNAQKIPFIIRRPMPNGGSEYWKVKDLKIID